MHPATDVRGVLYRGGSILTADPAQPRADAVATRAGRILAVGSERECRSVLGLDDEPSAPASPQIVELGGRALTPGFVDAHLHPMAMCYYAYHLDLSATRSIADLLDALRDRARTTAPGEWIIGTQLSAEQLAERRLPTIAELDAVGTGGAVVLLCRDGHSSIGNTLALVAAGIRGTRTDPPGGAFERDESGRLTGVCRETATRILLTMLPLPDLDQLQPRVQQVFHELASHGITSVGMILQTDGEGPGGPAGELESVGMMIYADHLPLGCHSILCGDPARAIDARNSSTLHDPADNRMVGGVKLFLDGTLGGRTACLHQPFADAPGQRGWLTIEPELAAARMETIHLAGLQICVHAIGDAANALALDLFSDLLERHPAAPGQGPRHRIEHASVLDEQSAERFAELGITAVVQPLFIRSEAAWLCDRLGPERSRRTYPFRSLLDAGVVVAGSSDAPLEEPDVLAGMAAAVTRHGFEPAQAITAAEALDAYTRGGALAQQREHLTGRLAEGLRADLVILSADPTAVPGEQIADIDVCATVVGGEVVYQTPSGPSTLGINASVKPERNQSSAKVTRRLTR
jgi:predicted amidohydrolase YtcJ